MTDDYTKEIRERLAAATPGPWKIEFHRGAQNVFRLDNPTSANEFMATYEANKRVIANAPTDISRLLEEREVLREALDKICLTGEICWVSDEDYIEKMTIAREALAWKPKGEKRNDPR